MMMMMGGLFRLQMKMTMTMTMMFKWLFGWVGLVSWLVGWIDAWMVETDGWMDWSSSATIWRISDINYSKLLNVFKGGNMRNMQINLLPTKYIFMRELCTRQGLLFLQQSYCSFLYFICTQTHTHTHTHTHHTYREHDKSTKIKQINKRIKNKIKPSDKSIRGTLL